ncbi:MAG: 50S ribosomal protein L29 [Proteobacteria bacterium]|nr:50S ribosomal protein L29 [Pseudomonadota bacterium]
MAKKKVEDLKGKTPDELAKMLEDLKKQQFNLRFQKSQGQLENTAQIRSVRREIARVKTSMCNKCGAIESKEMPKVKKAARKKAAA